MMSATKSSVLAHLAGCVRCTLLGLYVLLSGCSKNAASLDPKITITSIPKVKYGVADILDTVAGTTIGARDGQQIVLYARSEGRWWRQSPPLADRSHAVKVYEWTSQIHPGTDYAALLVEAGYAAPLSTESLPGRGGAVAAVATVAADGSPSLHPAKVLRFSGYDWNVRTAPSHRGGTQNQFDAANAWVDTRGALHLKIARQGDDWTCSEVQLTRNLGYGTYIFVVRDVSKIDLSAVLTLFTWDGAGPEENRHELAYEITRWGNKDDETNTAFVVQPYYVPTNVVRFREPAGVMTNSFQWKPSQATFRSYAGIHSAAGGGNLLKEHTFTSGIPAAGGDAARVNFYYFRKGQVPLQHENEVVIERFEYYP